MLYRAELERNPMLSEMSHHSHRRSLATRPFPAHECEQFEIVAISQSPLNFATSSV